MLGAIFIMCVLILGFCYILQAFLRFTPKKPNDMPDETERVNNSVLATGIPNKATEVSDQNQQPEPQPPVDPAIKITIDNGLVGNDKPNRKQKVQNQQKQSQNQQKQSQKPTPPDVVAAIIGTANNLFSQIDVIGSYDSDNTEEDEIIDMQKANAEAMEKCVDMAIKIHTVGGAK